MIWQLLISITTIALALVVLEWAVVRFGIPSRHSRKLAHVGTALLVIIISLIFGWKLFIPLGTLFVVVMFVLHAFFPLKSISDRRDTSLGVVLFPFGVAVSAVIAENQIAFTVAIIILGIADTFAYYVGSRVKSQRLVFGKSLAGSTAFFACVLAVLIFFIPVQAAFGIALGLAFIELFSPHGSDNFTVPVAAVLAFTYLL